MDKVYLQIGSCRSTCINFARGSDLDDLVVNVTRRLGQCFGGGNVKVRIVTAVKPTSVSGVPQMFVAGTLFFASYS